MSRNNRLSIVKMLSWYMDWLSKKFNSPDSEGSPNDIGPERRFQIAEAAAIKLLEPGQPISRDVQSVLDFNAVLFIGNQSLNTNALRLRGRDYQAIGDLVYPGKSAVLNFLRVESQGYSINEKEKDVVTNRTIAKTADRHDGIYYATIGDLEEAGYTTYYAPVRTNGLHVRIVNTLITKVIEFPTMHEITLPEESLDNLRSAFVKLAVNK